MCQAHVYIYRKHSFIKALERLLLVSVSGALFFALARNFPIHAQEFRWPPDLSYTLDRILRYLTVIWFLAYFFVSGAYNDLSNKARSLADISFDLLQSTAVLSATYALGFVLPDRGFGYDDGLNAYFFSNSVVFVICLVSLFYVPTITDNQKYIFSHRLFWIRFAGLVIGVVAGLTAWIADRSVCVLLWLVVFQLLLWLDWGFYLMRRLSTED